MSNEVNKYKSRRTIPHFSFRETILNRPTNLSTSKALLGGLAWLIISAIAGWHFDFVPNSIIGFQWDYAPLYVNLLYEVVLMATSVVIFYLVAVVAVSRKTPFVDMVGRMLYAHAPVILLMLPGILFDRVYYSIFSTSPKEMLGNLSFWDVVMLLYIVVIAMWYFYWSFCAFRRSTGDRGYKGVVAFVVAMWLSAYSSTQVLSLLMGAL